MFARFTVAVAAVVLFGGCGSMQSEPQSSPTPVPSPTSGIVVGSYGGAAGLMSANVYVASLNASGIPARLRPLPDPAAAVAALSAGRIDVAGLPADSAAAALGAGSAAGEFAKAPPRPSATPAPSATTLEQTMAVLSSAAAESGLSVLDAAEARDGMAFAVRLPFARAGGIDSLSQLADYSQDEPLTLAGPPGCRRDLYCRNVLVSGYGAEIDNVLTTVAGDVSAVVAAGDAGVGQVRSTDPHIDDDRLVLLVDDGSAMPPANIVVLTGPTVVPGPARDTLNRVQGRLTTAELRRMAADAGADMDSAAAVAAAWVATEITD